MHVCSNVTRWGKPKPPVPLAMSWGAGQTSTSNSSKDGPQTSSSTKTPAGKAAFAVDRPTMPTQQWGATIRVPLDKPVLLGAMTFAPEGGAGLDKPADNAKQLCLIAVTSLAAAGHAPAEKQKKP
jgi:hypothetical protein